MPNQKTIELSILDAGKVVYTAAATVDDDFELKLFDAYRTYYPTAPDNEVLFYQLARAMFEGIVNNIKTVLQSRPPRSTKPRFEIVGDQVIDIDGDTK
jgi:hypothetical protein